MNNFVRVLKGENTSEMASEILEGIITEDINNKTILLKPNVGFMGEPRKGLSTHPEVIRGLIKYFKSKNAAKIYVGDSSVIGINTVEALKSAGITKVCEEEGAICIDLNDSPPIDMKITDGYVVDSILLSSIIYDVDIVVSVGVMKTHMHTGASLSIKNMKGAMYRREKNKLHRLTKRPPAGRTERSLDFGILDLTTVCYPDYAVIDGTVGMEGFGPSGGTPKPIGLLLASKSAVACDMIALKLMGMELSDVGHVKLVAERDNIDYENIEVKPSDYMKYFDKFQTPKEARLELGCDALVYKDESACSACHATLTQFLRYHSDKFKDEKEPYYIFAGKDIDPEEIKKYGDRAFLLGACTAKFKKLAPFCKGCPPVTSELLKLIKKMTGVTVNRVGEKSLNIATKDYRILVDPDDYDLFKKLEPSHILIQEQSEKIIECAKRLQLKFNAELFCLKTVEDKLAGARLNPMEYGEKFRAEFGYIEVFGRDNLPDYLLEIEGINVYQLVNKNIEIERSVIEKTDILIAKLEDIEQFEKLFSIFKSHAKFIVPIADCETFEKINKNFGDKSSDIEIKLLNTGENFSYSKDQAKVVSNASYEGGIL
ncbi:MAG: DUF362 domain-containing protein [Tissierellia bacterium]|nr:DUF362 domain-containing protein [Tissierellia bacterium]